MLTKYGEKFDFIELGKLAIDYSDGIVKTSNDVNSELLNYAEKNGKSILTHPAEEQITDTYTDFYNKLIGE